jgi:hypothetical protein
LINCRWCFVNKVFQINEKVKTGAQASLLAMSVCFSDANKPFFILNVVVIASFVRALALKASRDACAPVTRLFFYPALLFVHFQKTS